MLIDKALKQVDALEITLEAIYDKREFLERHQLPDLPAYLLNKLSDRLLDVSTSPALHTCKRMPRRKPLT